MNSTDIKKIRKILREHLKPLKCPNDCNHKVSILIKFSSKGEIGHTGGDWCEECQMEI